MRHKNKTTQHLRLAYLVIALVMLCQCGKTNFTSAAQPQPDQPNLVSFSGSNDHSVEKPFSLKKGPLSIQFDPLAYDLEKGESYKRGLNIIFAVDVTASMSPNLRAVKDSIAQFVTLLATKNFDPAIGFVSFGDVILNRQNLTKDVGVFAGSFNRLIASGGGDMNEAALLAVQTAIEMLETASSTNALSVVLIVTDNPGHYGDGGSWYTGRRDCSIDKLVDQLNNLAVGFKEQIKIYDSTPDSFHTGFGSMGSIASCGGYDFPAAQWKDVRSKFKTEGSNNGKTLSYPLSPAKILEDFVNEIVVSGKDKKIACIPDRAELSVKGNKIANWEPNLSISKLYQMYKENDNKLLWDNLLTADEVKDLTGLNAQLVINRCCFSKSLAEEGDVGECNTSSVQTIDFAFDEQR